MLPQHRHFSIITLSCVFIALITFSKGVETKDAKTVLGCQSNKNCGEGELCHPVLDRCVPCECFCNEPENEQYCKNNQCQQSDDTCHRQTEYYDQVTGSCQKCSNICGEGKEATRELCDRMCSERKCCPDSEFRNPHNGTCDHCSTVCGPDDDPAFCFNVCRVFNNHHGDGPVVQVTITTNHDGLPSSMGTVTRYDSDVERNDQTTSGQNSQLGHALWIVLPILVVIIGLIPVAIFIIRRRTSKKKDQPENIELNERQPAVREPLLQPQQAGILTQNSNQNQQELQLLPPKGQETSEEPYTLDLRSEVNDDLASARNGPNNENSLGSDIINNDDNQNSCLRPVTVTSLDIGIQYREPLCTGDGLASTVSDETVLKELRT